MSCEPSCELAIQSSQPSKLVHPVLCASHDWLLAQSLCNSFFSCCIFYWLLLVLSLSLSVHLFLLCLRFRQRQQQQQRNEKKAFAKVWCHINIFYYVRLSFGFTFNKNWWRLTTRFGLILHQSNHFQFINIQIRNYHSIPVDVDHIWHEPNIITHSDWKRNLRFAKKERKGNMQIYAFSKKKNFFSNSFSNSLAFHSYAFEVSNKILYENFPLYRPITHKITELQMGTHMLIRLNQPIGKPFSSSASFIAQLSTGLFRKRNQRISNTSSRWCDDDDEEDGVEDQRKRKLPFRKCTIWMHNR